MNIYNVLQEIEKKDPEVYERLASRREAFTGLGSFGKKVALAAVPIALGSLFKKAYGQSSGAATVLEVLNFALTLEYLEAEFYTLGLASPTLNFGNDRPFFISVRDNENAHVAVLKTTIQNLGGTPVAKPTFDFSAKGAFANWNTNLQTYLTLSQAFEDTGVRAYKGQAANLVSNSAVLTAALQIHAVEARHAAIVRRIRGLKGWISGGPEGEMMPTAAEPVYAGEAEVVQATVNIPTVANVSVDAATEAFDEPLSKDAVMNIAKLFIV